MPLSTINKWPAHFRPLILAALIVLLLQGIPVQMAEASFLLRRTKSAPPREVVAVERNGQHGLGGKFVRGVFFQKARTLFRAPRYRNDAVFGIISLAASGLGLACAGIILLGAGPGIFLGIGLTMAISGIVFGAMGLRRDMSGLAIAGMVLGILEVLAAFVGLVVVIVAIASFTGC